jgi:hypothetical protein
LSITALWINSPVLIISNPRRIVVACIDTIGTIYSGNAESYNSIRAGAQRGVAAVIERGAVGLEAGLRVVKNLALAGVVCADEMRAIGKLIPVPGNVVQRRVCCGMIREVVGADGAFRDMFRSLGVVDVLVSCIPVEAGERGILEVGQELAAVGCLTQLVRGSRENAAAVSRTGLSDLFGMVQCSRLGPSALALLAEVSRCGSSEDSEVCVAQLCEIMADGKMRGSGQDGWCRLANVLATLVCMVESRGQVTRSAFRKSGGFDVLHALLCGMSGSVLTLDEATRIWAGQVMKQESVDADGTGDDVGGWRGDVGGAESTKSWTRRVSNASAYETASLEAGTTPRLTPSNFDGSIGSLLRRTYISASGSDSFRSMEMSNRSLPDTRILPHVLHSYVGSPLGSTLPTQQNWDGREEAAEVIRNIVALLTVSTHEDEEGLKYLWDAVGVEELSMLILNTGVSPTPSITPQYLVKYTVAFHNAMRENQDLQVIASQNNVCRGQKVVERVFQLIPASLNPKHIPHP